MELARAWTRVPGACSPPDEFVELLRGHHAFTDLQIVSGNPEELVRFDDSGGPRNADVNLVCTTMRALCQF